MNHYHVRRGVHLESFCTAPNANGVDVPDGCTLHEGAPPPEAFTPPDHENVWRFNMVTRAWEMEPPSEELLWARVRYRRDTLLAECDWVTLRAQEQGHPVPQAWLAYRQALRDITQQSDPANIVWPQAPEG